MTSEGATLKKRDMTLVHVVWMLALGVAVFLPALGRETGVDDREARHVEIAREMVQTGEYLVPHVLGKPYVDKPPLFNISVALMFELTGRIDWLTARLPGALCSIAMVLAIYALGRRWYNPRAGIWAAVIWSTSWMVIEWGRTARMDMMMAGLILFGILLADVAVTAAGKWARAVLWCAASLVIAGAVLSKGPQALFYFAVVFVLMWRARRGRWLAPAQYWVVLVVIVGGLAAGWAWITELRDPGHLRKMMEYQYNVGVVGHLKRPWLYFDQVLLQTAPWSLFSVGAICWLIRRLRRSGFDLLVVPFIAFAIFIIVMTFVPNKREHYLLPLLPLWSLFIAGFLNSAVIERQGPSGQIPDAPRTTPRWGFELPLCVCLIGLLIFLPAGSIWWLASKHAGKGMGVAVMSLAFIGAAAGTWFCFRGAKARAVNLLMLAAIILAVAATPVIRGYLEKRPPKIAVSEQIAAAIPQGATIGAFDVSDEYLFFKLNRDVMFLLSDDSVARFVNAPGVRRLLIDTARAEKIRPLLKRPWQEEEHWQTGDKLEGAISMLVTSP